jgi:3-oxoadipate enol-lactonase
VEHHVRSGDATISYQVEGDPQAPALLLINSIGSTRDMWARQMPAFTTIYRVIRYDARGHGQSSVPRGAYTLDQLGQDALAILDDVGASTAHVCGLSLGGITALWLGLNAANRVRGLVLANTAARVGTVEMWTERIALVHQKGMSAVAELAMERWFTRAFRDRDPETIRAFQTMVQNCPSDGYLGCAAALRDADLRERLSGLLMSPLLIASSADAATPPTGLEFIRERVQGAQLVMLNSAHLSNVECAEEFTAAVLEFLQAEGPRPVVNGLVKE